jgi:tripeptide aminopeptidase
MLSDALQLRGVKDAMQWISREKQWINEIHLQLCRVPAPTFLEQARAEWVSAQFRQMGCHTHMDRSGNVVATLGPAGDGPYIAVTAHLDTVIAPRLKEDIRVDPAGLLHGPGVSDNGAGLSALLALARALSVNGWQPDDVQLVFVANVGEEGEGNLSGMRFLCQKSPLAGQIVAFVVIDGAATDRIVTQALGSRRFDLTYTGPGGHSWSDYGIGNPVHALSRAVAALADIRLNGTPRSSLNVGIIEGGSGVNAIPAQARAKIDIRSESNHKIDELVGMLDRIADAAQEAENQRAVTGKVQGRLREIGSRPAGKLAEDAVLLKHVRAVDSHLGIRAQLDLASTDANIPLSMGVPAISIGAGGQGGGAHTMQEWFNPEGRDLGLKRLLLLLVLLSHDAGERAA